MNGLVSGVKRFMMHRLRGKALNRLSIAEVSMKPFHTSSGMKVVVIACLTPLIAIFVKPMGYSFYMFYPATPDAFADRTRLVLANIILVSAAAAAVASALTLLMRAWPRRRWVGLVAPAKQISPSSG